MNKDLNIYLKEDNRHKVKHTKDVPRLLGNYRLKQQWDASTPLLEWLKSETPTPPNAWLDVEQ